MNATQTGSKKMTKTYDFAAGAETASRMTISSIHYALLDIRKTLPGADAMDQGDGGNRGGYYRDEASVLHKELTGR